MKLKQLIGEVPVIQSAADPETEITGISYNSRLTRKGDLFVAIRGLSTDGHRYIPAALEAGAAAVLCEEEQPSTVPAVQVGDSRSALAHVSAAFFGYPTRRMRIIAVTGTSGKTTTTHLIKHILEEVRGEKVGLIGTNGNQIGQKEVHTEFTTPESRELHELFYRMAEEGCSSVVMEVSSHALAMERVAGIRFSTAAFTNLSQDHLDLHGTMEAYASEKKKLFSMCDAACINLDDPRAAFMMEGISCPVLTTSAERDASIAAKNISLSASGVSFTAVQGEEEAEVFLAIPGMFSVHNALTAISVCVSEGISLSDCAAALRNAKGVKGRVETVPVCGDYSVIIDYSHKPDALENVLKTLRPVTRGRLVVLFGCGGDRDRKKRPIMGKVATEYADLVIVTSDNPRTEDPQSIISEILQGIKNTKTPVQTICDRTQAIHWALDNACPGDVILLAGKGHEDYQVIGHEKHHMDEREIVADYLKEKSVL